MISLLNHTKRTIVVAHLDYAENSVVVLHDNMPPFRSFLYFDYEKTITLKYIYCAVFPETYAVCSGMIVPFISEIACRLTGICSL
jgi:hypothetical protein